MKIYIVIQSLWEDWNVRGAYDSLEKAQNNIKKAVDYYISRSNNKYEYKLIETKTDYEIRRIKKYEFTDGLVNDVLIDTFTIVEKELNEESDNEKN